MTKQSTIKNLLVIPILASAVLLSSPAIAANTNYESHSSEIRHRIGTLDTKKGVAGTVSSINGDIIIVTTKDNIQYTVDASSAMIMKASEQQNANPSVVTIGDINVGDAIVVRGTIADTEVSADKIIDGKVPHKKQHKHLRNHL